MNILLRKYFVIFIFASFWECSFRSYAADHDFKFGSSTSYLETKVEKKYLTIANSIFSEVLEFGKAIFKYKDYDKEWELSVGRFKRNDIPLIMFKAPSNQLKLYYLKVENERCSSLLCLFLSTIFPSRFSQQLARVVEVNESEHFLKNNEVEVIQKWSVKDFYVSNTIEKLKLDSYSKYGYQDKLKDLNSWYTLKNHVNGDSKKNLAQPRYCNYGEFFGYTNGAVYITNLLDNFCNIKNLKESFSLNANDNNPNECLYISSRKHPDGLIQYHHSSVVLKEEKTVVPIALKIFQAVVYYVLF